MNLGYGLCNSQLVERLFSQRRVDLAMLLFRVLVSTRRGTHVPVFYAIPA
jgi:hypothetical protein